MLNSPEVTELGGCATNPTRALYSKVSDVDQAKLSCHISCNASTRTVSNH